jgi:hypothetical protein
MLEQIRFENFDVIPCNSSPKMVASVKPLDLEDSFRLSISLRCECKMVQVPSDFWSKPPDLVDDDIFGEKAVHRDLTRCLDFQAASHPLNH